MRDSSRLTPAQRSQRARIAAHAMHSRNDGKQITAKATDASPGRLTYWRNKVDPERVLDPAERDRRAKHAQSEHFARLAFRASKAKQAKRAAQ